MSPEDRLQTLLHEAAHAICLQRFGPSEGHSRRFWRVARRLGVQRKAAPETPRLHAVRAANARYAYRCPGCAHEWTRRTPFGRARLCAACERAGRPARLVLVRRPKPRRG
jgi:predicted SprT family Zn-dependent metalloprotease